MTVNIYPPLRSGPSAFKGENRLFTPDAEGNLPPGWQWQDGTLSSGYDQGHYLGDYVVGPGSFPHQLVPAADDLTLQEPDGTTRRTYMASSGPWSMVRNSSGGFASSWVNGAGNLLPTGFEGHTEWLTQLIINVGTIERLAEAEWIATLGFEDNSCSLMHWRQNPSTYALELLHLVPLVDAFAWGPPDSAVRLGADELLLGLQYVYNTATGVATPVTFPSGPPGMCRAASTQHNRVLFSFWDTLAVVQACEVAVASGTVVLTPVGVGGVPPSDALCVARPDETFLLFNEAGIWRVNTTGSLIQVAGRHPATIAWNCRAKVSSVTFNSDDWLNQPTLINFVARREVQADGTIPASADAFVQTNLGPMFSGFQRKAVYTEGS